MEVSVDFLLEFEIKRLPVFADENQTQEDPKDIIHCNEVSGSFKCLKCSKTFTRFSTTKMHVNAVHLGKGYKCNYCPKTFMQKANMIEHTMAKHQGLRHKCELCEKVFPYKRYLIDHRNSQHLNKTYPCEACDKIFKDRQKHGAHMKRMHPGVSNQYNCGLCTKVFKYQYSLEDHLRNQHNGQVKRNGQQDKFECGKCSEKFEAEDELLEHIDIFEHDVHVSKPKMHYCLQCHMEYRYKKQLVAHEKRMHTKNKNSDVSTSRKSLRNHARNARSITNY